MFLAYQCTDLANLERASSHLKEYNGIELPGKSLLILCSVILFFKKKKHKKPGHDRAHSFPIEIDVIGIISGMSFILGDFSCTKKNLLF